MDPGAIPFLVYKLALFGLVVWAWLAASRDLRRLRRRQQAEARAAEPPPDTATRAAVRRRETEPA